MIKATAEAEQPSHGGLAVVGPWILLIYKPELQLAKGAARLSKAQGEDA
jgi:hypothetical protein